MLHTLPGTGAPGQRVVLQMLPSGVGRALFAAAEEGAREQGYELLGLTALATNHGARRFYENLGLGVDLVWLIKPLSST